MATWIQDITKAFEQYGGVASLPDIYKLTALLRTEPLPRNHRAIIRREIENHSSDSKVFKNKEDLFYTVYGLGKGIWGLRKNLIQTPKAIDLEFLERNESPGKTKTEIYRILRDTRLARQLKILHNHECQICGKRIEFGDEIGYSEAHHIQPLGGNHCGPDVPENILVLCPNHHVMMDYGLMKISEDEIRTKSGHTIGSTYINYHNTHICRNTIAQ